jgi:hypothetical protein
VRQAHAFQNLYKRARLEVKSSKSSREGKRMKSKPFAVLALAVGLLAFSGTLWAHHGTNLYDMTKPAVVKGTITQFEWGNPHNQIFFDATDDKGNVVHWVASTEPPAVMSELGWTRKSLKPGDQVTAYVFAAKNGAPVGNLQKIVFADGTELSVRRSDPPPAEKPN